MAILIIAEKPSMARQIAAVLGATEKNNGYVSGNNYIVSWCFGHLAGLAEPETYTEKWSGKWSFEQLPMIPDNWIFRVSDLGKEQFSILKKLMTDSSVTEIVCATDADREGECIFRYVYNLVKPDKPVKRLWISSLEESSIKDGFAKLRPVSDYDRLYLSGFCRARADWLVGMNGSRLFTCRYRTHLNTGRVQTPTLAMIVKRDYEVANFIKQKYFTVDIDCGFKAVSERIDSETDADRISAACNGSSAVVKKVEEQSKCVNPPKLYDLTSLQRDANRKFGYTAQQTSDYLQSLYEAALTTYPRTDSQYLTEDMRESTLEVISKIREKFTDISADTAPDISRCINNDKVTGHHAIIPTLKIENADIDSLAEGQKNILLLITFRLLCASSAPHKYISRKITLESENNIFTASGKTVTEQGWKATEKQAFAVLKCSDEDKNGDVTEISDVTEGKIFENISAVKTEHWTSPPKPFTEDTLLSAMEHAGAEEFDEDTEKKGLGTPATRAKIIETLTDRGYAERVKKNIVSTEKGRKLISVVPDEVKSPKLTADWENQLKQIETGSYSADEFMNGITAFIQTLCSKYGSADENTSFAASSPGKCPNCQKDISKGKYGFFCTGKCGMQISKVYKHILTESQLGMLLSGSSVIYTENSKKTTVLPECEPFSYTGNDGNKHSGFQWKTK